VRATWRYFLDERNEQQLLKYMYSYWFVSVVRGWDRAAFEFFTDCTEALAQAEDDPDLQTLRGLAMAFQGFFTSSTPGAMNKLVKESIYILERLDRPAELAYAYICLSWVSYLLPHPAEEKDAAQQALKIAEALDDRWITANSLWMLGFAEFKRRNFTEANRVLEAGLKLNSELNNTLGSACCLMVLGLIAFGNEDIADAKEYFLLCSQTANTLNSGWFSNSAAQRLGRIALLRHELPEAEKYLTQSLRSAYDLSSDDPGSDRDIASLLNDFARLRSAQNRFEESVELLSLLLQLPASHMFWAMEVGAISDHAKALLSDIEGRLSKERYEDALQRGELLNLEEVILELLG